MNLPYCQGAWEAGLETPVTTVVVHGKLSCTRAKQSFVIEVKPGIL